MRAPTPLPPPSLREEHRAVVAGLRARVRQARFRSTALRRLVVALRHRRLRPADALVVSYPRSGTTWTVFMLLHALTGAPADFAAAQRTTPYLGRDRPSTPAVLASGGRLMFSHETRDVGARPIVYLTRDPRSVVLSEYRWQLMRGVVQGSFDRFVAAFVDGTSNPWGAWDRHVRHWHDHPRRSGGRLVVVRYEDMTRAPGSQLRRILSFLGEDVPDAVVDAAVADNSLPAMREKDSRYVRPKQRDDLPFVGSGRPDAWQDVLDDAAAGLIVDRFGEEMSRLGYTSG